MGDTEGTDAFTFTIYSLILFMSCQGNESDIKVYLTK